MPAHAEHLAPRLRGLRTRGADELCQPTLGGQQQSVGYCAFLSFSIKVLPTAPTSSCSRCGAPQPTSEAAHCAASAFISAPAMAGTRCLPLWAAVCAFGKGNGASPRWDSIPSVLGRLCAFARGPRRDDRTALCPFDFVRDKGRWSQATTSQPQSPAVRGFFDGQAR